MANMTLDYNQMHDVASKIRSEQEPLESFVSRMQSDINELRGVWDSAAAQEFENTWNVVKPTLQKLYEELIPNIASQIDTAANNYQAADDAARTAAQS